MHKDQLELLIKEIHMQYCIMGFQVSIESASIKLKPVLANRLADFQVLELPEFVDHYNRMLIKKSIVDTLLEK